MNDIYNPAISYRREIDGLRSIAVLPVILFHSSVALFSGGYVGVDIFFVISGYLITAIILREADKGAFSIARFYERRAKRILPALFVMLLLVLPFAYLWMLPDELIEFSRSMLSVSGFVSNIFFWQVTDYFGPSAEDQLLLHMWSLAVEEQFYLLFPIVIILFSRFGKRPLFLIVLLAGLLSLGLSEWGWRHAQTANFYLLPTRAWELLAGALIAFIPEQKMRDLARSDYANVASLAGLAALIYAITMFDDEVPFPSLYALVPVGGTVLIIMFAGATNLVGRLLSLPFFVGIGLISYSAYLMHQPVLVLLRMNAGAGIPADLQPIVVMIVTLLLAWGSWALIETPVRRLQISRAKLFAAVFVGLGGFAGLGLMAIANDGLPGRFNLDDDALLVRHKKPHYDWQSGTCFIHKDVKANAKFAPHCIVDPAVAGEVMLLGDSHAAAIQPGLAGIVPAGHMTHLTIAGCMFALKQPSAQTEHCRRLNPARLTYVMNRNPAKVKAVVLHANWRLYKPRAVSDILATLVTRFSPHQIIVVGCVPQWYPTLPKLLFRNDIIHLSDAPDRLVNFDQIGSRQCNDDIAAIAGKYGAKFVSGWDSFCDGDDMCRITVPKQAAADQMELSTFDYGHLSDGGAALLARRIMKVAGP